MLHILEKKLCCVQSYAEFMQDDYVELSEYTKNPRIRT